MFPQQPCIIGIGLKNKKVNKINILSGEKMNEVYVTPNGEWAIVKQSDPEWQATFGEIATYFNAVRIRDNFLAFSGGKLKHVFEWFAKRMIISKDEAKYQISLLENSNDAGTE